MRTTIKALLAGAAIAAIGSAAAAQVPYGYGYGGSGQRATLYELPNFQGRSVVIDGANGNLSGVGFNDRARSARFDGVWSVCEDADYRGHCETLSGSTAYLPPRLAARVSSLRADGGGWDGGWGPPGYGGGPDTAVLYELPNFQGRSVVVSRENGNLDGIGFNDRARSVRIEGSWRLCEDAGFRGRCVTLTGAVPDLYRQGINGLSSLQRIGGGYPGYPGYPGNPGYPGGGYPGQGGVQGRSVTFYPGPVSAGYGYGSGVGRTAANAFCRGMGHSTAVYYDSAGGTLSDVLCRR